jgi:hypothetical protein
MADKPLSTIPAKPAEAPLAPMQPVTIDALLAAAIVEGRSADEVQQLHELIRTRKADLDREAFNRAFIQFKKDCPPIPRTRRTKQYTRVTDDGREVQGSFADLETIAKLVDPVLRDCGLSYRWTDTSMVDGLMVVVCRLAHADGHFEDSPSPPFPIGKPITSRAGKDVQSVQQVSASTSTYARRYSLISALGLTTVDEDDDGRGEPAETITDEQANTLNDLCLQGGETEDRAAAWRAKLCAAEGVETLGQIQADRFDAVAAKLNAGIKKQRSQV